MGIYQYSAKDKGGHTVTGMLEGVSESEIIEILHRKELTPILIKETKRKSITVTDKAVKLEDMVIFSRQLSTMIDSGIPLVQALGILSEQLESKRLKYVVVNIRQDIEAGMSFYDALGKHPAVFSELFINLTRAGESSGTLNEVLDRLATYLEKAAALTRKFRASLVYPAVVVSMAALITTVLLIKVVPTFKGIFDMLGGELPLPTRVLIGVSELLRRYFLLVVGSLVVLGFLLKKYINTPKGRYKFDLLKLKLPVLGPLFRKVALARFSRTFSTLVRSGIAVLNALEIVGKTAGNKVIEEAVKNSQASVRDGEPIARPLTKSGVFPPMVCRMISVGEQTGKLEKMLSKIADFYDDEVDAAVTGLSSLIEPLIIAFLGIVIGGIVISLFLPILKITQIIAR